MSGVVFVGQAHVGTADLQAEWDRASLRFRPRLLTAEGGEVEVPVAIVELFDAAAVRGVGVEGPPVGSPRTRPIQPVARLQIGFRHDLASLAGPGRSGRNRVGAAVRFLPEVNRPSFAP